MKRVVVERSGVVMEWRGLVMEGGVVVEYVVVEGEEVEGV